MLGFILTPTYRLNQGKAEVHLYGVLESGEPCLIIDDRMRPYFFVPQPYARAVAAWIPGLTVEACPWRSMGGEALAIAYAAVPGDLPGIRQRLEARNLPCFEADIRFAYRYLIDRGIRGAFAVDGEAVLHPRLGRIFHNPRLEPATWTPRLKVLSIDIETDLQGRVFAVALHTADFERVILVHQQSFAHAESVPSEKALIQRFLELLAELDPDVITGWNVVDFDLAMLARAARRYGLKLTAGRSDDDFSLQKDASFTRESRALIYGRQVLDGLALMRSAFIRLDDYKLETAAQAFLGRGKLITGEQRHIEIQETYRDDPQKLVDYNLQDARLVTELLQQTRLVELAVERSLLTGMQLDRVGAAIASIDSLYLNALRRRGVVAPSVGAHRHSGPIAGGYVLDSKPGLYRNIIVYDFKSLYPSIIRTFNIDPLTELRPERERRPGEAEPKSVRAPNGALFRQDEPGILPELLAQLAGEREQAKRAGNPIKANAIKILMNSFYGVLGASTSRLFSPSVANAVTLFGQQIIQAAMAAARRRGFAVIYGDTDSLFVDSQEHDTARAWAIAEELRGAIGAEVAAQIARDYGCVSQLELELEKVYLRFFLPELRGGKGGSKKRYAGLLLQDGVEKLELVGLEAVRRDWSPVSKRFQRELLDRVFHDRPVAEYVVALVDDLRAGKYDAELVYKKAIRKELRAYTKTTPPHIKAARKQGQTSGIVAYVMTASGPEPAEGTTATPDYTHYIEHQLAPIADAILRHLNLSFEKLVPLKRQLRLFD
ncbi:MAG TPA: DNA polymerase II [Terriglobales bacterium]|nr:DNA polymerase II [Terriglobales bacterium]